MEDEFLLAMALESSLIEDGWQVLGPVGTIEGALDILKSVQPSVAVLDANLGGELVSPVAELLRTMGVPFLITSAYRPDELAKVEVLNGRPHLPKPIEPAQLLSALNGLVQAR